MVTYTITWIITVACIGPGVQQPALFAQQRSEPVISEALQRTFAAAPERACAIWVFFTDKNLHTADAYHAALGAREAELSRRALRRRALRRTAPGLLDHRDLAPAGEYVAAVRNTGARLRRQSRWLNAVSVEATLTQVRAIAALPFVRRVRPLAYAVVELPIPADPPDDDEPSPRGDDAAWYGASYQQLEQINAIAAHHAGYTGSGVLFGVLDTGFRRTHEAFNQTDPPAHPVQIVTEYDFVNDDGNTAPEPGDPSNQHHHGTWILGTLGAYYPTVLVGAAFDASFILATVEDITSEYEQEEDWYAAGLEFIEAEGGDLATSSLVAHWYLPDQMDGETSIMTLAVNVATENGLVVCQGAGNNGHDSDPTTNHLVPPADAFLAISCGAVDVNSNITSFSSDGPTVDGREKPEVLARGLSTQTVHADNDSGVVGKSGTSLSTPLVAGATALVLQAHPDWTVDKVRRALMHTAGDFAAGGTYDPLYIRGHGIIDTMAAINFVHSDVDGDGLADGADVGPFAAALLGVNTDTDETRRADINADGIVNSDDVPIFVDDLLRH